MDCGISCLAYVDSLDHKFVIKNMASKDIYLLIDVDYAMVYSNTDGKVPKGQF
jgi:hypothetical protein